MLIFSVFYEFCWIFVAYGGAKGFAERPVRMDARQNCGEHCTYLRYKSIIKTQNLDLYVLIILEFKITIL